MLLLPLRSDGSCVPCIRVCCVRACVRAATGIGRLMDRCASLQVLELRDVKFYAETMQFCARIEPPALHTITLSNCKVLHNFRLNASFNQPMPASPAAPPSASAASVAAAASLAASLASSTAFMQKHCALRTLNLSSNPNLQRVSLDVPTLTSLTLSSCKVLHTLSINLPNLEQLNLR
jgi:hypothetical protein